MLEVIVYLSASGLGLLALPREAVAAFATGIVKKQTPAQTVSGILGAFDGGAESKGWYLKAQIAGPSIINLGALNLSWVRSNVLSTTGAALSSDLLGVKLGVLNTTVPLTCDGANHVVLQLDSLAGDYSAKLSRIAAQSDVVAARVEYTCTP